MNDTTRVVLSLAAGLGLGAFFFGGLWWTVSRLSTFERPALMMICSLLLRTGVTLGGFFVLSSGHWQRLLACLAGFALARGVSRWMSRRTQRIERRPDAAQAALRQKGSA
jgi:F1F0 ATPase subunit 2